MKGFFVHVLSIYLAGITGLYKGVPLGFALQASPYLTALFTALGSITAVFIIYFSGEPFKQWLLKKYGAKKLDKKKGKFTAIMDRYGVIGLGLVGTGIIGPIVTIILGMILVSDVKRLLFFLIIGVIIWSAVLTFIGGLGLEFFQQLF